MAADDVVEAALPENVVGVGAGLTANDVDVACLVEDDNNVVEPRKNLLQLT